MLVNYVNPTSNIYNAKTVYVIIEDGSDVNPNPNPTETKAILTMVGSNNDFAVALTKGNTADSPDITGATDSPSEELMPRIPAMMTVS